MLEMEGKLTHAFSLSEIGECRCKLERSYGKIYSNFETAIFFF